VIVVPTGPLVGVLEREDVTVKVVVAVLVPSVAMMVCASRVLDGTRKMEVKAPMLEVVPLVTCAPSYDIVTGLLGRKAEPVTVTEVPTGPLVGDRVMV